MTHIVKGVTYDSKTHSPIDCIFCRIQRRLEPGTIIFEDEHFVTFKTKSPASFSPHLLITPREHIQNLSSLSGPGDALLVERMVDMARKSLDMIDSEQKLSISAEYSFHVPPW